MRCIHMAVWACLMLVALGPSVFGQQLPSSSVNLVVPPVIEFASVATDPGGNSLGGIVSIRFSLYAGPQGGESLWSETQNVQLDSTGHYSVELGITKPTGVPMTLFTEGQAHWLGVQIEGQAEQPRVFLVSVPYALKAGDAATVGGLPPSAFVLAAPGNVGTSAETAVGAGSSSAGPNTSGSGTVDFIPLWTDSNGDLGNSAMFQSGASPTAKVGINTTTPAAALDVKGSGIIRGTLSTLGTLSLPATGAATSSSGKNSEPLTQAASAFNSSTGKAVNQTFQWQAEPAGNDTSSPSGTLNLLFGSGSTPAETGLHIASNGLINFAAGQTFPGTGNGTVTSVGSGTGLTGGPITGSGTLAIDQTVVPTLGAASNTFTGNITASAFSGNGAGVTNVNAATLGGFAASAFQPAGSYAGLGANTFTATQTISSGDVSLSSGNIDLIPTTNGGSGGVINLLTGFGPLPFIHDCCNGGNVFIGLQAGNVYTSGTLDVGIGEQALVTNISGSDNTALGFRALEFNSSGSNNTAVGLNALDDNLTGGFNTAVGMNAGATSNATDTSGSNNTFLGANSGPGTQTSLTNATAIGANAEVTESNALVLGSINGVNGATASTNIGIGTTAPAAALDVHGTGNFTGLVSFAAGQTFPGTGTITGVIPGTGMSGGGSSGNVTLNNTGILGITPGTGISLSGTQNPTVAINPAVVPQLNASNTFTGNQTVNGNLSSTGVVSGSSYEIGSILFGFGSYSDGNAFLGFAGSTAANNSASWDTAVGWGALAQDTFGLNTAIGFVALNSNTTGYYNTASGAHALFSNTTANYNTASGYFALDANTTGSNNTATGYNALALNTTGSNNTASGYNALLWNSTSTANYNTAIGYQAGNPTDGYINTGSNNTFVGANASTGNQNALSNATAIGANAEVTESNALVLGSIVGLNGCVAPCETVNVGIGTTAPAGPLHVNGPYGPPAGGLTSGNNGLLFGSNGDLSFKWIQSYGGPLVLNLEGNYVGIGYDNPDTNLSVNGGADKPGGGFWGSYSDRRLKTLHGSFNSGLQQLLKLHPIRYRYKQDNGMGIRDHDEHIGLVAQDVQKVIPEAVSENNQGYLVLNDEPIVWAMLNAIKEQQAVIREQQEQIRAQRAKMKVQETRISQQQNQINSQSRRTELQQAQIAELLLQVKAIQASLKANGSTGAEIRTVKTQVPTVQQ